MDGGIDIIGYCMPGTCLHDCTELEGVQDGKGESGNDREDYYGDEGI